VLVYVYIYNYTCFAVIRIIAGPPFDPADPQNQTGLSSIGSHWAETISTPLSSGRYDNASGALSLGALQRSLTLSPQAEACTAVCQVHGYRRIICCSEFYPSACNTLEDTLGAEDAAVSLLNGEALGIEGRAPRLYTARGHAMNDPRVSAPFRI
jgi:hypothetical protein